jgi:tetratricopeptide (TPR) repeat protein
MPAWVKPVAVPADTGTSSDAAVRMLLQDFQIRFTRDAEEFHSEAIARIQTPQGLAAMGTITLPWKPSSDVLTINKLQIRRGDQVIDVLAAGQTFTILRRENNLEYAALDGVLTATIQPAGLQVGDTLELAYTVRRSDPVLAGTSEEIVIGGQGVPASHLSIRAQWASSDSIRWKASESLGAVKENREGDTTEVVWALDNSEPLVQTESAPIRFLALRQLEFSGFKSWAEVSKRLAPLYVKAATLSGSSPLHAEIARIRAASADPVVRTESALALVQDQIRYVYLGMNDGALVPADADISWTRRFGDCKAKTALLLALLKGLDIDAQPVAVNTQLGDGLDARLPMIGLFNQVLVRAAVAGKTYWLDGTRSGDRHLKYLLTPDYRWGLPLVPQGAELVRIVAEPLTRPLAQTSVWIDATAGIYAPAPFHVESLIGGDAGLTVKLALANLTPGDLDRGLRDYWSKTYSFVDAESVTARYDEQTGYEKLTLIGVAHMDWGGDRYETDGLGVGYNADFKRQAGPNHDATFAVPFPTYNSNKETILLPSSAGGFTVQGEDINRTVAGVEYARHAEIRDGVFSGESHTRSVAPEFPYSEADGAQKALREMVKSTLYIHAPVNYEATEKDIAAERAKTPETADDYVTRGNMLMDHGDYDLAIADFDHAIAKDPKDDTAWADRGMADIWKKDEDRARQDLDAASKLNSRNAVVFRGRGVLAANAGKDEEAIAAFTTALDIEPGNRFALQRRGQAYVRKDEIPRALADFSEIARLVPHDYAMRIVQANLLARLGKVTEAGAIGDALIAENPDDAIATSAAAHIFCHTNREHEGIAAFEKSVKKAPSPDTYRMLSTCRPKADDAGRIADLEAARKLSPRSPDVLSELAKAQHHAGQFAEEVTTIEQSIAVQGENPGLLIARGIAHARMDHPAEAEKDFGAAREKARSPAELNTECWELAIANVALPQALDACEAAVAKAPDNAAIQDSQGFIMLRLARYEESVAAYTAALKLQPKAAFSLYGRGIALRRQGKTAEGDADLKAAVAQYEKVGESFDGYGVRP